MMKEKMIYGFILFLCSIALTIFIFLQYILINEVKSIPFGMSDNYVSLSIKEEEGNAQQKEENLREELNHLFFKFKDIIVVKIDANRKELSIYDTNKMLDSNKLYCGSYFDVYDFLNKSINALVEKDSATYLLSENNRVYHNGKTFNIKGVYDSGSVLFSSSNQYEIITTLFNTSSIKGLYYFDNITENELSEILAIIDANGYTYNNNTFDNMNYVQVLFSQSEYVPMLFAILFIYFSFVLMLSLIFNNYKRLFHIHWICGATKNKLFMCLMSKMFIVVLTSIILGNIFGRLLINHIVKIPIKVVFISILIQIFITILVLGISYYSQNIEIE